MENIFDAKIINFKSLLDVLFKELVELDKAKQKINKKDLRKTIDITENLINSFENIKDSIYSFEDYKDSNVINLETKISILTKNLTELEKEYSNTKSILNDKNIELIQSEENIKTLRKTNLELSNSIQEYISKVSKIQDERDGKDIYLQNAKNKLDSALLTIVNQTEKKCTR